jgi:hypothetical protein
MTLVIFACEQTLSDFLDNVGYFSTLDLTIIILYLNRQEVRLFTGIFLLP